MFYMAVVFKKIISLYSLTNTHNLTITFSQPASTRNYCWDKLSVICQTMFAMTGLQQQGTTLWYLTYLRFQSLLKIVGGRWRLYSGGQMSILLSDLPGAYTNLYAPGSKRVTQFQFSVCMYGTCGRIDNKADFDFDLTLILLWDTRQRKYFWNAISNGNSIHSHIHLKKKKNKKQQNIIK